MNDTAIDPVFSALIDAVEFIDDQRASTDLGKQAVLALFRIKDSLQRMNDAERERLNKELMRKIAKVNAESPKNWESRLEFYEDFTQNLGIGG